MSIIVLFFFIEMEEQGRQKRGGWGGLSRPTFRGKICHHSKRSLSTLGCHASLVPCDELGACSWQLVCT